MNCPVDKGGCKTGDCGCSKIVKPILLVALVLLAVFAAYKFMNKPEETTAVELVGKAVKALPESDLVKPAAEAATDTVKAAGEAVKAAPEAAAEAVKAVPEAIEKAMEPTAEQPAATAPAGNASEATK